MLLREFRSELLYPVRRRLAELHEERAAAEADLVALLTVTEGKGYNDAAAAAIEKQITKIALEVSRLERRLGYLNALENTQAGGRVEIGVPS